MQPWEYPVPPILYKFLPPERLHVLTECRIRFSQRTAFEDDHELQPDYAIFGTEAEVKKFARSQSIPLSGRGLPANTAMAFAGDPRLQKLAIENLQRNTTVKDELGVFCLTETNECDQMWTEYGDKEKGFVIGFNTTHSGFDKLKTPGRLGKVSYSDVPFGSALGAFENDGAGIMFRKRMKYAYEKEWRTIRLLKRLECRANGIFLSPFDPASVCEIIIRRHCAVVSELQQLSATDPRYQHVKMRNE